MPNSAQNDIASGDLQQFNVSIGLNIQSKLQDWPGRQSVQYGAVKNLVSGDFHSLADFKTQMTMYSSISHTLRVAWRLIEQLVPNNAQLLATLISIPGFGKVGQQVLSLVGISNILVAPQNILQNPTQFNATINSLT